MKEAGLICKTKRRFKVTTDSKHDFLLTPNHFVVGQANQGCAGDITYINPLEGWLYLAVVIDFFPSDRGLVNGERRSKGAI